MTGTEKHNVTTRSVARRIQIRDAGPDAAEVLIYDQIGEDWWTGEGVTAKQFAADLKALGPRKLLDVRINSSGGSVYDGFAIYNSIKNFGARVRVHVDGFALSIASVVAMAGDEINVAENGHLMLHNPSGFARGDAGEMRKTALILDSLADQIAGVYAARSGQSIDAVKAMMDAETWLGASAAKEKGFATAIAPNKQFTNRFDLSRFRNVPTDASRWALATGPIENEGEPIMSETSKVTPPVDGPANFDELKTCCVGADAVFLCSQLESQATIKQATAAWMAEQQKRIALANQQTADAKAAAEEAKAKLAKPGVETLTDGANRPGDDRLADPESQWNEAIEAKMRTFKDRARAVAAVVRENPELREAYVASYNERRNATARR